MSDVMPGAMHALAMYALWSRGINRKYFWGSVVLFSLVGTGCQNMEPLSYHSDDTDSIPLAVMPPVDLTPGSLYSESSSVRLFVDRKAYRVGDILTIVLDEQTLSRKKADTNINKNNGIEIPDPTVLGRTGAQILGSGHSLSANAAIDRTFTGKGSTGQSNMLMGSVTVMVQAVLESGALYVKGSKTIRLTQGDEVLFISGLVRTEDISSDNRVSSRRLADAKISYTGKGDLAEANSQGWLSRLLNSRLFPF